MTFVIILVSFIAIVIISVITTNKTTKENAEKLDKLKEEGFHPTKIIGNAVEGLYIDERNGLWTKSGMTATLKLSEIIDCELIQNGVKYKPQNGVFRAVVGGALFGGVGAVVGAATATKTKQVRDIKVYVYTSNPTYSKIEFLFLSMEQAAEIAAQFKHLKSLADKEEAASESPKNTSSTADELAKYKALLDNGAISQDEYDEVKKKLLKI